MPPSVPVVSSVMPYQWWEAGRNVVENVVQRPCCCGSWPHIIQRVGFCNWYRGCRNVGRYPQRDAHAVFREHLASSAAAMGSWSLHFCNISTSCSLPRGICLFCPLPHLLLHLQQHSPLRAVLTVSMFWIIATAQHLVAVIFCTTAGTKGDC